MEAGEKEMRKAFENVTTRNVKAAVAHSNETRKIVRELEDMVHRLEGTLREQDKKIEMYKQQITSLQAKIYREGS